jgi:hypothetical protein
MAVKGTVAKAKIIETIKKALGADFIGEIDKKVYVWADDGGERIQVALSLTCPKVPIDLDMMPSAETAKAAPAEFTWNAVAEKEICAWGIKPAAFTEPKAFTPPAEKSKEERDRIEALMVRLGL